MPSTDHYATLGVAPSASDAELKQAYRKRQRETHPDMGGSDIEFRRVMEAWEILGDPKARASYDRRSSTPTFDSTIFDEPQFHPGSPFTPGASAGFGSAAFDAAAERMAEQVRRMSAERAAQNRFRAQVDQEVSTLRVPKWPLNLSNVSPVFGSLYASHRYAGVEYEQVLRWRSRDAWYVRLLITGWLITSGIFLLNLVILPGDTGAEAIMTWLFVVLAATFVAGLAGAVGLIGAHIGRWLNYTIPKRQSAS